MPIRKFGARRSMENILSGSGPHSWWSQLHVLGLPPALQPSVSHSQLLLVGSLQAP